MQNRGKLTSKFTCTAAIDCHCTTAKV